MSMGFTSPFGSPHMMPLPSRFMVAPLEPGTLPPPAAPARPTPQLTSTEIRGVGIKFGERLNESSGGIVTYVKRLINNSPAHHAGIISPGDVLVRIDGEDVYGCGLSFLRNKIPGPANTSVKLGFRGSGGRYFEVQLRREAYGSESPVFPSFTFEILAARS